MSDDLLDYPTAAELLGVDPDALEDEVAAEGLRVVSFKGESFVLGADVARVLRDRDPKTMAKLVGRPGGGVPGPAQEDDADQDDDSPRRLGRHVPRR